MTIFLDLLEQLTNPSNEMNSFVKHYLCLCGNNNVHESAPGHQSHFESSSVLQVEDRTLNDLIHRWFHERNQTVRKQKTTDIS